MARKPDNFNPTELHAGAFLGTCCALSAVVLLCTDHNDSAALMAFLGALSALAGLFIHYDY